MFEGVIRQLLESAVWAVIVLDGYKDMHFNSPFLTLQKTIFQRFLKYILKLKEDLLNH